MGTLGIDDVTAAWLAEVVGTPSDAGLLRESVGSGQVANCYRVTVTWEEGKRSFIVKVPSRDETSRATARFQRLYLREISFYRDVAPFIATRTPECYFIAYDSEDDSFLLLLEDLAPTSDQDQFRGLSSQSISDGLEQLASLHSATAGRSDLHEADWLAGTAENLRPIYQALLPDLFTQFLVRYDTLLDGATRRTVSVLATRLEAFMSYETLHPVLQHGDFRTDNLLFDGLGGTVPITVVDWQTTSVGSPLLDVAFFLTTSLNAEDFSRSARAWLRRYLQFASKGGLDIDETLAESEFARYTLQPIVMLVAASMIVERTERGDEMFLTMIRRGVAACAQWRALEELERRATA